MYKTDVFISAEEIKEKGYLTVTGRVSRKYFEERFYGLLEKE